ncbi:MAG: hypothetical protein JO037_23040 [Actinobacteria bacterium]|nr:hypothetical protein [Actinomycetota bacterium]
MGADQPDEPDTPSDGPGDRGDDQGNDGSQAARPSATPAETRDREECYADLRMAAAAQEAVTARRITADEQASWEKWSKTAEEARWMWGEYLRRFPPDERPPVDRSGDAPGTWRIDRDRILDAATNARVEAECDRIADREREKITPAIREIESQDPDRHLAGLERCVKGRDRIKEKIYDGINFLRRSPEEAVSLLSDTIRFTFQYPEDRYTQGVWADIGRLKEKGFEQGIRKNFWTDEQYKGVNSEWIEPESGQRIEVQFHTRISFEAKQLTHEAYERLRTKKADKFEELVLEAFQSKVSAEVPVPPGAIDIPDYLQRGTDAK